MKFSKKLLIKILCLALTLSILIYAPCCAVKNVRDYEIFKEPQLETKIYTIYHVETFEGGSKARSGYLADIARSIEKEFPNILFMIKNVDCEELESSLKDQCPEIISFGYGVGNIVLPYLVPQSETFSIRDNLLSSGMFDDKIFAYPYIASGYANFTHGIKTDNFHVGTSSYIHPEKIYQNDNLSPKEIKTSYEAYKDFIYDKTANLLGTARDVFRIENLNKIGRLNAHISPIEIYSDLIQYIGITRNNEIAKRFVSLSLSQEKQSKLIDYSLFSVNHNKIYSSGIYNDMENAIFKCEIAKVFK